MTRRLAKAYLRLMKYAAFLGITGGAAIFIGPEHSVKIKIAIGTVIGMMLLGRKLPNAITEFFQVFGEFNDELFGE